MADFSKNDRVIVILDEKSRNTIKSSISSMSLAGIHFIDGLEELSDELLEITNNVVVLEGFMTRDFCLSELKLYSNLYDLQLYFLGSSKFFNIVQDLAKCYECDLATLDYSTVMAALYGDASFEVSSSKDYFSKVAAAETVLSREGESPEAIEVAEAYLNSNGIFETVSSSNEAIQKKLLRLEDENERLRKDRDKLLEGFREVLNESEVLNHNLQRYEEIFTKDIYEKLRLHDYNNRPMVIYMKEFEDFLNLDELVDTLVFTLRLQDRKNVKVIRLFDSATSRKILTVPDHYRVLHNRYMMSDVIENDFLCKSGDYRKVLDKILTNEVGLDILIIVDSKSYDDIVVSGAALNFNLCREVEHLELFKLSKNNTLVNSGDTENDLYWGFYDTDDMDNNEKMVFLSSRPVIRKILEMSRYFAQSA